MDSHELLPSVQSNHSSSTISSINIDLKLKSKDTIWGHLNYSSSCYRSTNLQFNPSQSTWCHNYLSLPSNMTSHVTQKDGNNNLQDHPSLTTSVTISPYNLSIPFVNINFFLFNNLVRKNFYIKEGLEGGPSIINVGGFNYSNNIMNCVY